MGIFWALKISDQSPHLVQEREKHRANHWRQWKCHAVPWTSSVKRKFKAGKSPDYWAFSRLRPSHPLPPWHCAPIWVIASTAAPWVEEWAAVSARGSAAAGRRKPTIFRREIHRVSGAVPSDQSDDVKWRKNQVLPSGEVFRLWFWGPHTFSERFWTYNGSISTYPWENRVWKRKKRTHMSIGFDIHVSSTSGWL